MKIPVTFIQELELVIEAESPEAAKKALTESIIRAMTLDGLLDTFAAEKNVLWKARVQRTEASGTTDLEVVDGHIVVHSIDGDDQGRAN